MASVTSSLRWILISQIVKLVVYSASLVILARLLAPSEQGLMALALVVINFATLFRDMGTASAVVQKEQISDLLISSLFWTNVFFGCFLAAILFGSAGYIADFFSLPKLKYVLWALSIILPISSACVVHQALLERSSSFKKQALIEISASSLGLVIVLVAAWFGLGVFSLVLQSLTVAVTTAVFLWFRSSWKPKCSLSFTELSNIWKFSSRLTLFSFVNYFARNIDGVLIGRFISSTALGIYSQSYKVMIFPLQIMTVVASRALFPLLSRRQNELESLASLYLKSFGLIAVISGPMMGALWILREPFVEVVLGEKWYGVASVIYWLAPVGFIQSLISTTGTVFTSLGRTDYLLRLGILGAGLQVSAVVIGLPSGVEGIAKAYFFANVLNFFPCMFVTFSLLNRRFSDLLPILRRALIATVIVVVVTYFLVYSFNSIGVSEWVLLLFGVVGGLLTYFIVITVFFKDILIDFLAVFKREKR